MMQNQISKISFRDEPACFEILSALQNGISNFEWIIWIPLSPMLVMGRFSSFEEITPQGRASGFRIHRRLGGGGTVVLDEGTICLEFGLKFGTLVRKVDFVNFIKQLFVLFAKVVKLPLHFSEEWYDLLYFNRKIGGSTLYFSGNIAIYGFSLIYSVKTIERIEKLLQIPPKQPSYRENRGHRDFLVAFEELTSMSLIDAAGALEESFKLFSKNCLSIVTTSLVPDEKQKLR